MPSRVRCFLLTPTDDIEVSLRRFAFSRDGAPKCTRVEERYPGAERVANESHDAEIVIGREFGTMESADDGDHTGRTIKLDDPRWPWFCACGFEFTDEHTRQECRTRLYKRSDTGELVTISNAPAGALYDARRFGDVNGYNRNAPGVSLVCKTPAGEWLIDGPASNGPGWTRTGTPPDISVHPSIGIGSPQRLHGWLRAGWLEIDAP